MAFVVRRPGGRFEIRESIATPGGPRPRTLATFRVLTDSVLESARARAQRTFDEEKVKARAAALKVPRVEGGAAVTARKLIAELRRGEQLPPGLVVALRAALPRSKRVSDSLDDVIDWIGADSRRRGQAARELADLTSRFPTRPRPALDFPRIRSS
jgi:hypothetical protein